METMQPSKRRRADSSGGSVCIENVERNDGGVYCKHKVFLSHSDIQKNFVERMCDKIERKDRSAFFDKNRRSLSLGCDFPEEIIKAIEECEAGVVVLSKAFFTRSWWPMEEFARLAKRKEENPDFVLILVFYDIELAKCRNEKKQNNWKQQWEEWAQSDERIVMKDWTSVFKLFGPTLSISYEDVGGDKRLRREVVAEVCKHVTPETRGDDLDMQGSVYCKHKVFLCHSGEQKDFVESIHNEFEMNDRSAFFDKNRRSLSLGCDFPKEIFKAIEECEAAVVVLSKAFFTRSRWPMEEFARLAKRKEENPDFVLILVFHKDIEREECRNEKKQNNWKQQWEEWAQSDERIVMKDWTSVFKLFGPTLSISYEDVGGDKRLRREVVAEVCKHVTPETRGDDPDMQGRQRICELVWGKMQASKVSRVDGTRVVGLYGMGGIGKSTLCKALCEKLRSDFRGKVCHAELASNSDDGKEEELLGKMAKRLIDIAHGFVDGYNKTKRLNLLRMRLREQRVFLVIDNVEDGFRSKQLVKDLLNATYAKDSFVVVTARSIEILQDVGINGGECQEMPELDYEEAKSLFLNKAPQWVHQKDSLIKKCVKMCYKRKGRSHHYHPLALKVLGGQLGYDPEKFMLRLERGIFSTHQERESIRSIAF